MKPSQFILLLFITAMLKSTWAVDFDCAIHQPKALRRMETTTELSDTESAGSAFATSNSVSASTSTTETEAPTTIMVLLPDNLAPSYSGSGSVMFFDGSVGDDGKDVTKSAGSSGATDEVSGAASKRNSGMVTVLTAFTILLAHVLA